MPRAPTNYNGYIFRNKTARHQHCTAHNTLGVIPDAIGTSANHQRPSTCWYEREAVLAKPWMMSAMFTICSLPAVWGIYWLIAPVSAVLAHQHSNCCGPFGRNAAYWVNFVDNTSFRGNVFIALLPHATQQSPNPCTPTGDHSPGGPPVLGSTAVNQHCFSPDGHTDTLVYLSAIFTPVPVSTIEFYPYPGVNTPR